MANPGECVCDPVTGLPYPSLVFVFQESFGIFIRSGEMPDMRLDYPLPPGGCDEIIWSPGDELIWSPGDVALWQPCCDEIIWSPGDELIWSPGDVAEWLCEG